MHTRINSITDQVYNAIRTNIMTLKIAPGTAMSEKDLGERLNVSRTPVREAFIRLGREGLVNIYPQRGTYVSKISIDRAKEERFLREALELAVFREFFSAHGESAVGRLRSSCEKQSKALEEKAWDRFIEYDDQFHEVFYQETGRMLCNDVVKETGADYYRIRYLSVMVNSGIAALNFKQHVELLSHIEQGNEAAVPLLAGHLRKVFTELNEMQEKYPGYFTEEETNSLEALMSNLNL